MLKTLDSLTATQRQSVLADATARLLPDPGIRDASNSSGQNDAPEHLLKEVRHRLKIHFDDRSPQAYSRMFSFLADEMQKSALPPDRASQARKTPRATR